MLPWLLTMNSIYYVRVFCDVHILNQSADVTFVLRIFVFKAKPLSYKIMAVYRSMSNHNTIQFEGILLTVNRLADIVRYDVTYYLKAITMLWITYVVIVQNYINIITRCAKSKYRSNTKLTKSNGWCFAVLSLCIGVTTWLRDALSIVLFVPLVSNLTHPRLYPWWRHQIETYSVLLAICAESSPVSVEFPAQRPVTRSFNIFFDLRLYKRLSKQSWGWPFETLSCPLWRQCNVPVQCQTNPWTNADVLFTGP